MSIVYTVSREELEKYATTGFHLAVDHMRNNKIITEEQAKMYESYACVILSSSSIYSKLKRFFIECEDGYDTTKVIAVPTKKDNNE